MGAAVFGALVTGALTWYFTGSIIAAIVMAGLSWLAYQYRPKPKGTEMKPASLSDFSITQANEGQPIPIVYGRVKIPGNIIYYGNLRTEEVKEEVDGGKGGGGDEEVTTGYKYYLDIWQAICMGKIELEKAFIDNDENKPVNASYTLFNDGTSDVHPTTSDNPDLEYASRLPGVAHIFWKQFYIGFNRTYVPTVYFWVKRILETGLPYEDVEVDGVYYGNNPAAVIYDLLVNWGKLDVTYINSTSFSEAAEYFYNQKIGINYVISSTRELREVIQEICDMVDAQLEYDDDGKIAIRVLKKSDTPVGTIKDDFISFQFSKPSWNTVPNEFQANFVENGVVRTLVVENPAAKLLANKDIQKTYDLTAFSQREIALKRLFDIMKRESYPRIALNITVPLKYSYYNIGDVITVENTEVGIRGDFRIVSISEPKIDSNEIEMTLLQHTDVIFDEHYLDTGGTHWIAPTYDLEPFTKIKVVELEYTETYKTNPAYLICVSKEKGYETGFAVYVSTNGTDYKYQGIFRTFATAGTIVNDYPDTTYDIDDEVGVIFRPYKEFKTYDNISRDRLFVEPRVLIIDDEIMTFQNYDPYGETDYHITGIIRGIHWSGKAYHNAGAEAFIVEVANNVIQLGYTSTFYMKIVPVFADRIGSLEDATAIEINPTLKARKPLKPERVTATRISDTDTKIDVFVKTKVYLTGAGKVSADSYTDTYPFEYEGQIVAQISGEEEVVYDKPNFVISNRPEKYNLTVKAKWNGYISDGITITVPAGSSWFDPSEWQYKRQITVTEQSGKDLTDYQILIELNSTNFDFSHANEDGSDIRFYDGSNLYPYWIEKWDSSNQEAKIWVKVPSIPASSSTSFYMYYGNPNAASASNGEDTFEFFDDFDGTEIDTNKWDIYGNPSLSNSEIIFSKGLSVPQDGIKTKIDFEATEQYLYESRALPKGAGTGIVVIDNDWVGSVNQQNFVYWAVIGDNNLHAQTRQEGNTTDVYSQIPDTTNYHTYSFWWKQDEVKFFIDYETKGISSSNIPIISLPVRINTWRSNGTNDELYVDWFRIRKYTDPEPNVSIGSEEPS